MTCGRFEYRTMTIIELIKRRNNNCLWTNASIKTRFKGMSYACTSCSTYFTLLIMRIKYNHITDVGKTPVKGKPSTWVTNVIDGKRLPCRCGFRISDRTAWVCDNFNSVKRRAIDIMSIPIYFYIFFTRR